MEQELAYSFHLGSDKNKSKLAKRVSKDNVSGTTSLSNNAIQNANDLSRVNKHNLRDYDKSKELIRVIYGSNNIINDVKDLYLKEFEESRLEYNSKQTREDRKIKDYFEKVCESSPHMHIVGVPVVENCTRGMKKKVGKSQIFTKESLTKIQDKMRNACIKSYNKFYEVDTKLKEKQKGRNQDINVKDMSNYKKIKKQLDKNAKKLAEVNNQTEKLDNSSKDINAILEKLKPSKLNKNNNLISNEDVEKIKKFTKDVKDITKTVRSVNDLNRAIKDFEHSSFEIAQENSSLKYQLELKTDEIDGLKKDLSTKENIISKLQAEKEKIKQELQKFKDFWYRIMGHFHKRICYDKDENYKIVSDDLYKNGIFTDDENEIANNIVRKVKPKDEINKDKNIGKKNDTRF